MNVGGHSILPCFSQEQVKGINKEIRKHIYEKEPDTLTAGGATKKGDFFPIPLSPLLDVLYPWLYKCQIVNRDFFGYDIDWKFHLDSLNYNVYGVGCEYDWHIDANTKGVSASDIKLTCLLNLSEEPYGGGDFYMMNHGDKKTCEFNSGETLIFTSLWAHKVTPVTKGERITLTYWATGPSWR